MLLGVVKRPAPLADDSPILTAADAVALLGPGMADFRIERLRVALLDAEQRVIEMIEENGGAERLGICAGRIVREICRHKARAVILAHNHPSGDPTPSGADRLATRRLAELLRVIEVALVDHLVIARGGIVSFRAMGLL